MCRFSALALSGELAYVAYQSSWDFQLLFQEAETVAGLDLSNDPPGDSLGDTIEARCLDLRNLKSLIEPQASCEDMRVREPPAT